MAPCALLSKSSNAQERTSDCRFERKYSSKVTFKKIAMVVWFGVLAALGAGCSGAGPTPTRTPRAIADNGIATQTPWFIYVPVTTTPEPFTITPLPTVTSSVPTPKPANTRAPRTAAPAATKTSVPDTEVPTTPTPEPSPTPSCGEAYQVSQLTFPADGDLRSAKGGGGASKTIQFKWVPVVSYQLDPTIGYHIVITGATAGRSSQLFISHDGYLKVQKTTGAVLSQQATFGLIPPNADAADVQWNVTVVKSSGGFDDQNFAILGTPTSCGPPSPSFTIHLTAVS